jgi:hypothetical protein
MITVTRSPFFYEPVYQNSILFGVTSSLSTREDFRYGFELYKGLSWSGINESVVRTFAYPRPDGSGLYTPHEFLKDNLSYDVNPFILAPTQSYNSLLDWFLGTI